MSATNRGAKRLANDLYVTPSWCVHRLLEELPLPDGEWLEPAIGTGAIVDAVTDMKDGPCPTWTGVDIDPRCVCIANMWTGDYLTDRELHETRFDVCITNPPYSLAMEFITTAMKHCDVVCMLLRLNFLASEKRAAFMRLNPPDVYVLPNRPDFSGDGGDATEYAWSIWYPRQGRKEYGGIQVLGTTPKEVRRNVVAR